MEERREPPPERPCICGSSEHQPLHIGETLPDSGAPGEAVYVCPAESPAGLKGAL